jgi:hypothetical protein
LHYFDDGAEGDYRANFVQYGNNLWFESTPSYLHLPGIPEKINNVLCGENVRILIMHRHPVDRAYSHYLMNRTTKYEILGFDDAVRRYSTEHKDAEYYKLFAYVERGLYYRNAVRYMDIFGEENVFFLELSSLKDKEKVAQFINRIFKHKVFESGCEMKASRENRGGIIDNPVVAWLYGNESIRNMCRAVVDPRILHLLKKRFQSAYPSLTDTQRKNLMEEYFCSDYENFKKLVGQRVLFENAFHKTKLFGRVNTDHILTRRIGKL